jgi:hypothetical protein
MRIHDGNPSCPHDNIVGCRYEYFDFRFDVKTAAKNIAISAASIIKPYFGCGSVGGRVLSTCGGMTHEPGGISIGCVGSPPGAIGGITVPPPGI